MKNILKFSAVAALSLTLFSGCIEEVEPTSGATADQVVDSPYGFEAQVKGLTAALIEPGFAGTGYHFDFGYPSLMIVRDMFLDDVVPQGNSGYDWWTFWSSNSSLSYDFPTVQLVWNSYYPWIKSCNDIIKLLKGGDQNLSYLGIAYTYRALFYLDLVRMYEYKENEYISTPTYFVEDENGDKVEKSILGLAVPIVTEEMTEEQAANNPRATVDEIYDLIFSDLKNAETYLAGYTPSSVLLPGLPVVYGLYARAYLERAIVAPTNYAKAAEYARMAITASGCTPLTQSQWEDPKTGFNSMNSQNSWMLAMTQTKENIHNLANFTAWMANEQTWGYSSVTGGRVTYNASTRLYNAISNKDFRKHSFIDPAGPDFYSYKLAYPDAEAFYEAATPYVSIKFRPVEGNTSDYNVGNAADIPMMRVEEMYLIEAEAAAYTNLANGQNLLNTFMKHRILDGSYNCSSIATFEDFQKEIALQKRIEFWGEGIVYFDYKRLRLGLTRGYADTNYYSTYIYNCNEIAPWWTLPIPRSEIQNNKGIPQAANNPDPSESVAPWVG